MVQTFLKAAMETTLLHAAQCQCGPPDARRWGQPNCPLHFAPIPSVNGVFDAWFFHGENMQKHESFKFSLCILWSNVICCRNQSIQVHICASLHVQWPGQVFSEVPCAEFGAWLETLAEHALTDSICSKWLKSCYIILRCFIMFHSK